MLFSSIWRLAAASAATVLLAIPATAQSNNATQSTFVSPAGVAFGMAVPDDVPGEQYLFTIRAPIGVSWAAVGLGSDDMVGALILMIYINSAGDNVTLSPRLADAHHEPRHYPDFKFEVLAGTGLFDEHMVLSARCTANGRQWNGGNLILNQNNVHAIYAVGPPGILASSNPAASVKYHASYGSFRIDVRRTLGSEAIPVLDDNSVTSGVEIDNEVTGKRNIYSPIHGVAMIFCFVGLFPLGVLILRVGSWMRIHAINQGIAVLIIIVGLSLGIKTSLYYQKSRGFNSYHQVLGLILVAFVFIQFFLGFFHHHIFKKTQLPTKFGKVHVWLGRVTIIAGTVNAFLGFNFARNPRYNYILAGLVFAVVAVSTLLIFGRGVFNRLRSGMNNNNTPDRGYDMEPWRQAESHPGHGGNGWRGGTGPALPIGLVDVSAEGRSRREKRGRNDLGSEHRPREFA